MDTIDEYNLYLYVEESTTEDIVNSQYIMIIELYDGLINGEYYDDNKECIL